MTIAQEDLARCAEDLFVAREDGRPIPPLSKTYRLTDAAEAYAVQEINTRRWLDQGRRIVGRKIGLTSKAVQAQLGVDQPDYGQLWADGDAETGRVAAGRYMQPRIEAEIAFVMKRDVTSTEVSMSELIGAIDYALPAVEIVDSAIADWKITLADTIADNASAGGFMLGASPRTLADLDLRLCGMVVTRRGEAVSTGLGAACLGHPLNATLWLARTMARVGRPLAAGEIVLSGALGPMVSAAAGDRFEIEIQGFSPFSLAFED